jgi:hypothetical protein
VAHKTGREVTDFAKAGALASARARRLKAANIHVLKIAVVNLIADGAAQRRDSNRGVFPWGSSSSNRLRLGRAS